MLPSVADDITYCTGKIACNTWPDSPSSSLMPAAQLAWEVSPQSLWKLLDRQAVLTQGSCMHTPSCHAHYASQHTATQADCHQQHMLYLALCFMRVSYTSASILLVDSNCCCSTHADHNDFDPEGHSAPFMYLSVSCCLVTASTLILAQQTILTRFAIAGEVLVTKPHGYPWLTC